MLTLEDLSVALQGEVLVQVSAGIRPGEVLSLMGASGSGKSTLLRWIAGFADPAFRYAGRILLSGADVTPWPPEQRRIGLLFQDPLLFPHLSVAGNLRFAMPPGPRAVREDRLQAGLRAVGLAGFGPRDPATLSGGQRARVALLRVLLAEPRAVLLDEPFSALDAQLRAEIRALVFAQIAAAGLPAILVTHDPEDAAAAGGPVIRL